MLKQRAIIAFWGKEMHSLIRFSQLTSVQVHAIIHPSVISEEINMLLSSYKDISLFKSFEEARCKGSSLLLIGFTRQLSMMRGTDYLSMALDFAVRNKLNVFCFDNIYDGKYETLLSQMDEKGLRHHCPLIQRDEANVAFSPDDRIVERDPKGIMIVGTSSKQGKFTLMLRIISKAKGRGIRLGTIGSEHQSALLGIDSVFPYGVAANVMIPIAEYPTYLQQQLVSLYENGAERVLSCSQSGILPYSLQDIYNRSFTLATISFYLALMPSIVVLVVNSAIDSIQFIDETIHFIEHAGKAAVVALAFSDNELTLTNNVMQSSPLTPARVIEIKERYRSLLGLESFNIMDDGDIDALVALLIGTPI